jgi:hypothetical protein
MMQHFSTFIESNQALTDGVRFVSIFVLSLMVSSTKKHEAVMIYSHALRRPHFSYAVCFGSTSGYFSMADIFLTT